MKIYPSLIAAPQLEIKNIITLLEPYCDGFHLDIMDFHFVPNLTWGPDMINAIRSSTTSQLWVHFMVDQPSNYLKKITLNTQDIVTIHREHQQYQKLLLDIKKSGYQAGLAYNPATPLDTDINLYKTIDQIVIMSVEPGFSGQQFQPNTLEKVKQLVQLKNEHKLEFSIALDGGINLENFSTIQSAGADTCAIGSALFKKADPITILQKFKQLVA